MLGGAALVVKQGDDAVVITRLADLGGAHGYSQPGRITILDSLTPADTAAVLVHEFAHLCTARGYVLCAMQRPMSTLKPLDRS